MAILEYFSDSRIALQQELQYHEELWPLIAKYPPQEFEMRIAEIAAYCEVILDGYYTVEDLDRLCEVLVKKLYEKRTGVLVLDAVKN